MRPAMFLKAADCSPGQEETPLNLIIILQLEGSWRFGEMRSLLPSTGFLPFSKNSSPEGGAARTHRRRRRTWTREPRARAAHALSAPRAAPRAGSHRRAPSCRGGRGVWGHRKGRGCF